MVLWKSYGFLLLLMRNIYFAFTIIFHVNHLLAESPSAFTSAPSESPEKLWVLIKRFRSISNVQLFINHTYFWLEKCTQVLKLQERTSFLLFVESTSIQINYLLQSWIYLCSIHFTKKIKKKLHYKIIKDCGFFKLKKKIDNSECSRTEKLIN